MKCAPVRLSCNYFKAKMKLIAILDPLLTYTSAISGWHVFLMPFDNVHVLSIYLTS